MEPNPDGNGRKSFLVIVLPVCTVLGLFFIFQTFFSKPTQTQVPVLDRTWHTPKTARAQTLEEKTLVGNCFICHMQLVPDPTVRQPAFAHKIVKLEHGKNDRCFNCHLIQDRNKYAAEDGSGIMHTQVEILCSRCHGLIYNDWLNGVHGVRWGQWSATTQFERTSFNCTHCHDPHSPVFKFKEFTPPPVWPEKFLRYPVNDHSTDTTSAMIKSDREKS